MSERERGPWTDPRFLLMAGVLIVQMVVSYVRGEAQGSANREGLAEIKGQVSAILGAVGDVKSDNRELKVRVDRMERDQNQETNRIDEAFAHVSVIEKNIAYLQARGGRNN